MMRGTADFQYYNQQLQREMTQRHILLGVYGDTPRSVG